MTPTQPLVARRDRDVVTRALAVSRLFRGLEPQVMQGLVPHADVVELRHGARLWACGVSAEHFHVVLRGVLELQRGIANGDTTLIALFGPGESPAVPVTLERRRFLADAYAATAIVEVLRVRAEPVLAMAATDARLANAINRALLDHCRLTHAKIDVLAAGAVPRRLAVCLLDLAERLGDEQSDGTTRIPLYLSRQQLATYVGARVETTIRTMSLWQKQGLVHSDKEGFSVPSVPRLRAILEGGEGTPRARASELESP